MCQDVVDALWYPVEGLRRIVDAGGRHGGHRRGLEFLRCLRRGVGVLEGDDGLGRRLGLRLAPVGAVVVGLWLVVQRY